MTPRKLIVLSLLVVGLFAFVPSSESPRRPSAK
jgi:hypothetical protein